MALRVGFRVAAGTGTTKVEETLAVHSTNVCSEPARNYGGIQA